MAIKRLKTAKATRGSDEVIVIGHTDGREVRLLQSDRATFNTPEKLRNEVSRQLGDNNFHFHINRDGSIAMAYGQEPELWPEDE